MEIVNGFRTGSKGQPIRLWDHKTRSLLARAVCEAAKLAGANKMVQTAAGDAAYAGKTKRSIELVIKQAGGTDAQGKAATEAVNVQLEEIVAIPSDRWEAHETAPI